MIEFPGPSDRTVIVGRTGSGKTMAAAWHLSMWDFNTFPWVIINTKDDSLLNTIGAFPKTKKLHLLQTPQENGLYMLKPMPDEGLALDAFFERIWKRQNIGVYVDEGYMIDVDRAFNRLLTQGRSRNIPMIVLSQRPVYLSRFVYSESDYFQVFNLNMLDDRKKMAGHIRGLDREYLLPEFHSLWYDVAQNSLIKFAPVPDRDKILSTFRTRLTPEASAMNTQVVPVPQSLRQRFI